mmetsp:Transcript_72117/g.211295  ORF Transcript_72117/g.211295 Transcript_72117/m.211295 type:complete len:204 (-) Transcript_72117:127-738(-)
MPCSWPGVQRLHGRLEVPIQALPVRLPEERTRRPEQHRPEEALARLLRPRLCAPAGAGLLRRPGGRAGRSLHRGEQVERLRPGRGGERWEPPCKIWAWRGAEARELPRCTAAERLAGAVGPEADRQQDGEGGARGLRGRRAGQEAVAGPQRSARRSGRLVACRRSHRERHQRRQPEHGQRGEEPSVRRRRGVRCRGFGRLGAG